MNKTPNRTEQDHRISKDEYYLTLARTVSLRSTCTRRQYGAIIVSQGDHILSTGYNGAARNEPHCLNLGCERERLNIPKGERYELCVSVHAEANAIIQAARGGVSINGATLYVNGTPCKMCWRLIKNAGIDEVVFVDDNPDSSYFGGLQRVKAQQTKLAGIRLGQREEC
ncbi:MAG: dCMP deaminase family protein [Euryarchaeota archaeon]|nr:dCMP deaminase family protein [Euryarchaeota archaeon]